MSSPAFQLYFKPFKRSYDKAFDLPESFDLTHGVQLIKVLKLFHQVFVLYFGRSWKWNLSHVNRVKAFVCLKVDCSGATLAEDLLVKRLNNSWKWVVLALLHATFFEAGHHTLALADRVVSLTSIDTCRFCSLYLFGREVQVACNRIRTPKFHITYLAHFIFNSNKLQLT